MAVTLSPLGGVAAQFFNNDGVPLSGGLIYTYLAGTNTPATTYTTGAGTIAHSNPIVLDSAGRVPTGEIWLSDSVAYKFVIKDSSANLIGTYDNIVGINSNFVNHTASQEIQTATAGQTVFTLTTMAYQPGTNSLSVFVDGVNQYGPGAQYAFVETSATSVTFASGLHVGASVKFTTAVINNIGGIGASQVSIQDAGNYYTSNNVEGALQEVGANQQTFLHSIGEVKVFPPGTGVDGSNVLMPDGTWLNVSASTTSGLQEAINVACTGIGTIGYDLTVYGGDESTGGAVVYNCTTPLAFPSMQGKKIRFGATTINFTSAIGSNAALTFDSCMMVDVEMAGTQIVNNGTGHTVLFEPTVNVPLDPLTAIIDSKFHITTAVNINAATTDAIVAFQPAAGDINQNVFEFEEINHQNAATGAGGVIVFNSGSGNPFANNKFTCMHIHNVGPYGLQLGTTSSITNYGGNIWTVSVSGKSLASSVGVNTFGSQDTFFYTLEGGCDYAIKLQSTATRNTFVGGTFSWIVGLLDNTSTDKTSNIMFKGAGLAVDTKTTGGSPFNYQNTSLTPEYIVVQSGTVTQIYLSSDGSTYYDIGATQGQFTLQPGAYIRVAFSVAPNIRRFYYNV